MGRGKKNPAGHRGGDISNRHATGGSDHELWDRKNPEDDPLLDLRPHDEEFTDPAADEYIWPEITDENDEYD
jgi:hypothetical protein